MKSYVEKRRDVQQCKEKKSQFPHRTPCHLKLFKNNFTVVDPGKGPGGYIPSPLFLDQTEARRAEKKFLGDRPPPPLLI